MLERVWWNLGQRLLTSLCLCLSLSSHVSEVTSTYKSAFKGTWHLAGTVTGSALIPAVEAVGGWVLSTPIYWVLTTCHVLCNCSPRPCRSLQRN